MRKFWYWLLYGSEHRWFATGDDKIRWCTNCERVEMTVADEDGAKEIVVNLGDSKALCYSSKGVER